MIDYLIRRAKKTPYFNLPGYMNRDWLVPYSTVIVRKTTTDGTGPVSFRKRPLTRLIQLCGLAVRVHEILASDPGKDPHDHPWAFLTIILRGGYYEQLFSAAGVLISTAWHGPGSVLYRPAGTWHKLILPKGETATTLFITGQKKCTWGFNVMGTKIPHNQYQGADE